MKFEAMDFQTPNGLPARVQQRSDAVVDVKALEPNTLAVAVS